jgi:hypothetical protein
MDQDPDVSLAELAGQRRDWVDSGVADTDRLESLHPERRPSVRDSIHIYGTAASLCIEPTTYGGGATGQAVQEPISHTLTLEIAPARAHGKGYDWHKKIQFRLTRRELPMFCAVLMGYTESWFTDGHGPANNKRLDVVNQPGRVFIKLRQDRLALAVPVTCDDLFEVMGKAIEALRRNHPSLDPTLIAGLTRRTAQLFNGRA